MFSDEWKSNCKSSILDALENDTNLHDVPGDWFEGPF